MPTCIYCRLEKPESDFGLEHIIPQSLGGASAPDYLKTRMVCGQCNHNLGLFVDASFEKNWFVSHQLRNNARLLFDPTSPTALPLVCMGPCNLTVPGMSSEEVCESWLGPFGEQVYWIRPKDERLFWYVGGNPRTTKTIESRAYFILSVNSQRDFSLVWRSFENPFPGKKVRKVMCTSISGADPLSIGFSEPDEIDESRVNFFLSRPMDSPDLHISLTLNTEYDFRFMAKLGTGLSYAIFGQSAANTPYSTELHKALWHKPGKNYPLIAGQEALGAKRDPRFTNVVSVKGGVCIIVTRAGNDIAMNLCLSPELNWILKIAESPLGVADFSDFALILFGTIGKSVHMPLNNFIAHQIGTQLHPELSAINARIGHSLDYFKDLQP